MHGTPPGPALVAAEVGASRLPLAEAQPGAAVGSGKDCQILRDGKRPGGNREDGDGQGCGVTLV